MTCDILFACGVFGNETVVFESVCHVLFGSVCATSFNTENVTVYSV